MRFVCGASPQRVLGNSGPLSQGLLQLEHSGVQGSDSGEQPSDAPDAGLAAEKIPGMGLARGLYNHCTAVGLCVGLTHPHSTG